MKALTYIEHGKFALLDKPKPVILDPGVGTYVKETFGSKRYTLWNNQSDWHNLPLINGCSQIDA